MEIGKKVVTDQFRPRCLLADEVALGKTIEAALTMEELDRTNEELNRMNEELDRMNEELDRMNEEQPGKEQV